VGRGTVLLEGPLAIFVLIEDFLTSGQHFDEDWTVADGVDAAGEPRPTQLVGGKEAVYVNSGTVAVSCCWWRFFRSSAVDSFILRNWDVVAADKSGVTEGDTVPVDCWRRLPHVDEISSFVTLCLLEANATGTNSVEVASSFEPILNCFDVDGVFLSCHRWCVAAEASSIDVTSVDADDKTNCCAFKIDAEMSAAAGWNKDNSGDTTTKNGVDTGAADGDMVSAKHLTLNVGGVVVWKKCFEVQNTLSSDLITC